MITKEQVLQNIENNQHVGDASPWVSAGYFMTGSGLLDSFVTNAVAKETSFAFENAIKTGIYNNHSILGGNFLYNTLYKSKVARGPLGFINTPNSRTWKIPFVDKFKFNFMSKFNIRDTDKFGQKMAEYGTAHNLTPGTEMVRTGFGIGKNYDDFFKLLREQLFTDTTKLKFATNGLKANNWNSKNLSNAINKAIKNKISILKKNNDPNLLDSFYTSLRKGFQNIGVELPEGKLTQKVIKEASDKAADLFTTKTFSEKIFSSKFMRMASGVGVTINIPALMVTGASITASIGQSNAINNFISSHLYNTKESEGLMSMESIDSINSSYRIQETNLKNLSLAYSDINTARRYMNDLDPISLDLDSYHLDNYDTKTEND